MVVRNIKYTGAEMLQRDIENSNYISTEADNLKYNPVSPYTGNQTGLAQHTHYPTESMNVLWSNVNYNITMNTTASPQDFTLNTQLYGLPSNGAPELIAEDYLTTCSSPAATQTRSFDLLTSACYPPFKVGYGTATDGKIRLNLPKRWSHYDDITLNKQWHNTLPYRLRIPLTSTGNSANSKIKVTIPWYADMQRDFDDIRFTDYDGKTELDSWLETKTDSTSSTWHVEIPSIPASPVNRNCYAYYGDGSSSSASTPFMTLYDDYGIFDDFEDNKYTGRSAPYTDWSVGIGTASIDSTTPLNGTYSVHHIGSGASTHGYNNIVYKAVPGSYGTTQFKFMLTAAGTGTYKPWIFLWYLRYQNTNNFVLLDTYYSGGKQKLRVDFYSGGVSTYSNQIDWLGSPLAVGTIYDFKIQDTGSRITVWVDDVQKINFTYNGGVSSTTKGFGSNYNCSGNWDLIRWKSMEYTPLAGTLGGEESTISIDPDAASSNDMYLNFSTPTDWTDRCPSYVKYTEVGNLESETNYTLISAKNTAQLGYNGLDKYNALRVRVDNECNTEYELKFNWFEYIYEV
jgi:hypothetical protein